jgi:hypothetical protein
MNKEWYMCFDNAGLPIAVFYTESCDRASFLYSKLYKKEWEECVADGITIMKEEDVPLATWEWIATEFHRPSCKIELPKNKCADMHRLIQSAAMKVARDSYLENKKDKDLKSKWALT